MKLTKQTIGWSLLVVSVVFFALIKPPAAFSPSVQATTTTTSQNEQAPYATIPEGSTYESVFPDEMLGRSIASEIQGIWVNDVDLTDPVTQSELDSLTVLFADADGTPADNLEGLQYPHHLKNLYIIGASNGGHSLLTDLTPLQHLTELELLSFNNTEVQDLTPIKNLTQLKELVISLAKVQDVGPLAGLTNLEKLDLRANKVQDLTPLQNLEKLHYLEVGGTFTDARPIQHLPLFKNPEGYWWLISNVVLPDAYVGQPITIEAYGLNHLLPYEEYIATVDGRYKGVSTYNTNTHQLTWLTSGTKGAGIIDFREYGGGKNQIIKINFLQQVHEAPEGSPVTVTYEDADGEALDEATTLTGKQYERYRAEAKEIAGYRLISESAIATGTFTDKPQTITFVYQKLAESQPVTVTYEDVDGNPLDKNVILTGDIDQAYQADAKEISGYTLTNIPENASGTFTDKPQNVAFVYQKNIQIGTGTDKPGHDPNKDDQTLTITPAVSNPLNKENQEASKPVPFEDTDLVSKELSLKDGKRLAPLGDSSPWILYVTGGLCLLLGGRLFRKP